MKLRTRSLMVLLALQAALSVQATLIDRGGGLIYDTVLNITWLKDANYAATMGYDVDGGMSWHQAINWADWLVYQGYSDWRLPACRPANGSATNWTKNSNDTDGFDGSQDQGYNLSVPGTLYAGSTASELCNLFYFTLRNPGNFDTNGNSLSAMHLPSGRTNSGPFTNFKSSYWSSGTYLPFLNHAWRLTMTSGEQSTGGEFYVTPGFNAWAVRDGDSTPLSGTAISTNPPLTATWQSNQLVISWPSLAMGFFLKSSSSPNPESNGIGATNFIAADILDMLAIEEKMRVPSQNPADLLSAYLSSQLPQAVTNMLASYDHVASLPDPALQTVLASEFSRIITQGPLYTAQRFASVPLSPWTQALLAQNPEGAALVHLNRLLIEDAYPIEMANSVWQRVTNAAVVSADRQTTSVTLNPSSTMQFFRLYHK